MKLGPVSIEYAARGEESGCGFRVESVVDLIGFKSIIGEVEKQN